MVGADVLLLYQAPGQRGMSGKIYEYLATGRPVLCVAPADNLAYRVVAELGAGECAEPDDPAGIEAAILALYHRWKDGRLEPNAAVRETALERYSRPKLTAELAGVLDAAIDERSSH
jgi:glycosyltransferase involved in cell wall biosynthesis